MTSNITKFTNQYDIATFANKFLCGKMTSLENDTKRCLFDEKKVSKKIGQPSPFPALLYCFSIIDLLGLLHKGMIPKVGELSKAAGAYMRDFMHDKPHEVCLLQEVFRHSLHIIQNHPLHFSITIK